MENKPNNYKSNQNGDSLFLFVFNVNSISCLPFVQLVCTPELVLLIFKFHTLGLILESALCLFFLIALTVVLSK